MKLTHIMGPILAITIVCTLLVPGVHTYAKAAPLPPVKVLILTMFPPEHNVWLSQGTWKLMATPRITDDGAVYCQLAAGMCKGVYLMMTGPEKVNAAISLTALLSL